MINEIRDFSCELLNTFYKINNNTINRDAINVSTISQLDLSSTILFFHRESVVHLK